MKVLKSRIENQVSIFKESVVRLVQNHGYDIMRPIKVLDVYTVANIVDKFEDFNGTNKIIFEGYRSHPFHEIDVDQVLNVLVSEEQIEISDELSESKYVHSGISPGDHREFTDMLMKCVNKTFLIKPNFNMPATDSNYIIPEVVIASLPKSLIATVLEINKSYLGGLHIACGVLLRRLLEGAILLKYKQLGKTGSLKKDDGDYKALNKMINIVCNEPTLSFHATLKSQLLRIKWVGDKGAHSFDLEIFRNDIKNGLLYIREFLEGLKLEK